VPLVDYSLQTIANVIKAIKNDPRRTNKVLCLSYPDIIASEETLVKIFGKKAKDLEKRKDSFEILNWHKAHHITSEVVDTKALFAALGYEMHALDISEGRGGEIIHDLSEPLPISLQMRETYDLVFDCISNQCFNVAQAWATMVSCCRVYGYILSVTPVTMINQGFWNVSPQAYAAFAEAHGLDLHYEAHLGVNEDKGVVVLDTERRQRNIPDNVMNVALMHKPRQTTNIWPIMSKFKRHPKCLLPLGEER